MKKNRLFVQLCFEMMQRNLKDITSINPEKKVSLLPLPLHICKSKKQNSDKKMKAKIGIGQAEEDDDNFGNHLERKLS